MRGLLIASAVAIAALLATPASAQRSGDPFAGTWAFQTTSYGDERVGAIMSGAAVITRAGRDRYTIRLVANERLVNSETGQQAFLTARQNCTGQNDAGQFTITCQLSEPVQGYEPDNFVLQVGETDQLVGVLRSQASPQVMFSRVR